MLPHRTLLRLHTRKDAQEVVLRTAQPIDHRHEKGKEVERILVVSYSR